MAKVLIYTPGEPPLRVKLIEFDGDWYWATNV